ncbi:MAG TPA: DUF3999 family protein [Saprospiraceae bacterium]|nr:DUF3999 family protein [Saprospiraceae bacterium]
MKQKSNFLSHLLFFFCSIAYGQIELYNYKRELINVTDQWHTIILPDDIFGKTLQNLNDIRIFGITSSQDTIEAPYVLRLKTEKISGKEIAFKTLNASHNERGYFFTFEIPASEAVNQINLDFKQRNFDWRIRLEGSQNQVDWFTISDQYRILSIYNEITDFQFTKLIFPDSKYRFIRLFIDSKEKPELSFAGITHQEITNAIYRNYTIRNFNVTQNRKNKQTEIDIQLIMHSPVSLIYLDVKDLFDYYRPITIQYLKDSINTDKGWFYNYYTLKSGILNSIDNHGFTFPATTVKNLKIIIDDKDNTPLTIGTIQIKGYEHELLVRLTEKATYFLAYGNKSATKPNYDISLFTDKVPGELTTLETGNEQIIGKRDIPIVEPLFKNKLWLWTLMVFIILVLGWFSIKMISKNQS